MPVLRKVFDFLRSKVLALSLMISILATIFVATAILPEPVGRANVFEALWFNALLVMLVLNTAFCFFSRIHRRGWTLVSTGMIIFHLSFVAVFAGIIINSLFYYQGALRLTEGETIEMIDANAYDEEYWGLFFRHEWMRGVVTFHKLHTQYREDDLNKGVANEISITDGEQNASGIIYPTRHLAFNGFKFYRNKDGFAPLFVLYDGRGNELYGAYVSLQSFEIEENVFLYTSGTKQDGPGGVEFPQIQGMPPVFSIQFTLDLPKRAGDVRRASFKVWEYDKEKKNGKGRLLYEGSAPMGEKVSFGDYALSMNEVRYWASMDVLYTPGQPIVLASLWAGLSGMIITTIGRMRKGRGEVKAS